MPNEDDLYVDDDSIEFPVPKVLPLTASETAALNGSDPEREKLRRESPQPDGPVFTDLRDVQARNVEWLDKPFLPWGELVTVNADGDTGKGLYAVHQASRVSRGEFGDARMVVFAVAEDAFETVLKPRLLAAEANLAHVRVVSWRRKGTRDALRIPDDVPELARSLLSMAARMLVVDPLLSHLSAKTHSHIDHEVRLALQPLVDLAHSTGCLVLGNGNFTKDKSRGARSSAQGSGAFTNTPRVGLAMAYDDEDPDLRIVEVVKSNVGQKNVGRIYRVHTAAVDGLTDPQPLLVAEGAASKSVDDLIAATKRGKRIPAELVRELILAELDTGEKSRKHLDAIAADKLGASGDTVYQSGLDPLRKAGCIRARKESTTGGWLWDLTVEERMG